MLPGLQSCASRFSSPARVPATASRNPGAATATTTASTTPTKRTVRRSPAPAPSSSATTGSSASTSRTSATESLIVRTDLMSSDVHPLLPTSAPTSSSGQLAASYFFPWAAVVAQWLKALPGIKQPCVQTCLGWDFFYSSSRHIYFSVVCPQTGPWRRCNATYFS